MARLAASLRRTYGQQLAPCQNAAQRSGSGYCHRDQDQVRVRGWLAGCNCSPHEPSQALAVPRPGPGGLRSAAALTSVRTKQVAHYTFRQSSLPSPSRPRRLLADADLESCVLGGPGAWRPARVGIDEFPTATATGAELRAATGSLDQSKIQDAARSAVPTSANSR